MRLFACGRLLGALLLTLTSATAQQTGALRGAVIDPNGDPPGWTTVVKMTERYFAYAGADGRFRIADIVPGVYTVTISHLGYRDIVTEGIEIRPGVDTDLGVQRMAFSSLGSVDCGGDTQSKTVKGPAGMSAVLKVHTEDDHAKDHHTCAAEYSIRITRADGTLVGVGDMGRSDAEWGRRIVVHLDGFSQDGKHIYGVISEGGQWSYTAAVDHRIGDRYINFIVVKRGLQHLRAANCGTSFAVAGVIASGGIVLEPNTASGCRTAYRWLLATSGEMQPLPKDEPLVPLYPSER